MIEDVPVIETERLILRGPEERDFDAFAAFSASERAKWIGGPFPRDRAWGGFLNTFGHWALRGYGMWMLEHRASGATAGRVGMIFNDGWDGMSSTASRARAWPMRQRWPPAPMPPATRGWTR